MCSSRASTRPPKYNSGKTVSRHQSLLPDASPLHSPRLRRRSLSSADDWSVWKLRDVRMRSSFGRGEERDVDRTDSSGEGGTVASEKRTVVGVADERTVCEESSIGLRGPGGGGGGGAEKRRRVRGDVASAYDRFWFKLKFSN